MTSESGESSIPFTSIFNFSAIVFLSTASARGCPSFHALVSSPPRELR